MRNRFPGTCCVCGVAVPANEGELIGPPWKTKCALHAENLRYDAPKIELRQEGGLFTIKPTGRLGDKFNDYRKAIEGARFEKARELNTATLDKGTSMVSALKAAGFVVDVPPDLAATFQAKTAEIAAGVIAAEGRADKVDAILRERGLSLFPFQRTGVAWLASRSGALLADEMGLGKTIQTLAALPENAPVLVICPAVAKGVWKRESAKWRPDFKVSILSGRGSFRWPTKGEIVVINADILSDDFEAPIAGTVVVADEAHMFKGGNKTARGRRFAAIAEATRKADGKVWLLTATPLLNRAPELWNLYMAGGIANEAFGSFTKFKALFNAYDNGYGLEWGQPDPEAVAPLIRKVCLRRLRTEVLPELPVKTWRTYDVDLDGKAKKALDKMLASLNKKGVVLPEASGDDEISIDKALEQIKKLDGTSFSEFSEARAMLAKAKIPVMLEIVEEYEEQDEPLVVFSAHRAPIDLLATRPGWRVITGDTSAEERTEIEEQFQAGKLKGVGATIKAGGVAITLTKSASALFVDRELTPALNAQAEDRVCRIGQTRGVVITTLVADHPLDAHITGLLDWKRALVEKSVDAARIKQGVAVDIVTTAPAVDFAALAAEVQAEINAAEERKNKAQEAARERQKALPADTTAEKEEAKARRERRRQRILETAKKDNTVRRPARDAREEWAHEALVTLADLDPDRAQQKNDMGFNASDGGTGHVLAVLTEVGLTEAEWSAAIDLCKKYHRQVGRCPAA